MALLEEGYRLFNDLIFAPSTTDNGTGPLYFTCFPRLPPELRLHVWKSCLPYDTGRLVHLLLVDRLIKEPPSDCDAHDYSAWHKAFLQDAVQGELYTTRNSLGNIVSNFPYEVMAAPTRNEWYRALLGVNREARHVFLSVYRLPLQIKMGSYKNGYRIMTKYLDPDNDIVAIQRQFFPSWVPKEAFVAFLHDIVANDPRGQGIAHLAMGFDCNDLPHFASIDKSKLHPLAQKTLCTLLSKRLKTFYSVVNLGNEARNMLSVFSWIGGRFHHNRSMPQANGENTGKTIEFALLPEDPRPIDIDLSHMAVGTDPRRDMHAWYHILTLFGVSVEPAPPMQTRYMLAQWEHRARYMTAVQVQGEPSTREQFIKRLQAKDKSWVELVTKWGGLTMPVWGEVISSEEEYNRLRRELLDVVGAWVFEADAFGRIPYNPAEEKNGYNMQHHGVLFRPKMVVDVSKQKRPRLMVYRFDQ